MILVTGAGGMVGAHLSDVYRDDELIRTDLIGGGLAAVLDVRDRERVTDVIAARRPAMVLHLAAETDVERCERDAGHAHTSNAEGTRNVAMACRRYDAEMVYVSTAAMFDDAGPELPAESDTPRPLSVYAQSKYEGEQAVASLLSRYYIVRAGWMFGGREGDKKFVGRIARLCASGQEVLAVNDRVGNPTSASELLTTIRTLTSRGLYGLYHCVNGPPCTRYDIAIEIARQLGSATPIRPVSADLFPAAAPRARSEAVSAMKLERLGIRSMRDWRIALASYLATWTLPRAGGLA